MNSERGLGRWQATALALSFIVGSGILVLPVLSLELAGATASLQAWMFMALLSIPLVIVFYKINSAENVSLTRSFAVAFGEAAREGARFTVLAALIFGMPAMITTTAGIITRLLQLNSTYNGILSHVLLTALCLNHLRPLRQSTRISMYSAVFLCFLIVFAVSLHVDDVGIGMRHALSTPFVLDRTFLKTCAVTFFGYVGWESLGFFANELRDPKRDLKWVFGLSFVIVSFGYLALSAAISGSALSGQSFSVDQGILALLPASFVRVVMSAIVVLLLIANLNAWIFGGKKQMQEILSDSSPAANRKSLFIYYLLVSALLLLLDLGKVGLADLFLMSNQSWIVIYGGVLAHYFKIVKTGKDRIIGLISLVSFMLLLIGCSKWIMLNGLIFLVSYLRSRSSRKRSPVFKIKKARAGYLP